MSNGLTPAQIHDALKHKRDMINRVGGVRCAEFIDAIAALKGERYMFSILLCHELAMVVGHLAAEHPQECLISQSWHSTVGTIFTMLEISQEDYVTFKNLASQDHVDIEKGQGNRDH